MTHLAQGIRLAAIAFVGGAFVSSAALIANDGYVVTSIGKPGTGGVTPTLTGSGELDPGGANTLDLSRARANSTAALVAGFDEVAAPFKGGILGPSPDSLAFGFPISSLGKLSLPFTLPADAPADFDIWLQFWVTDTGASANLSSSNTLRLTISPFDDLGPMFPAASYPMGPESSDVILRDIDDDGVPDILSSSEFSNDVNVLLGRADGTFESLPDVATGLDPVDLEVADINADGLLDLIVASERSGAVSLHAGLGDGLFGPATLLDVGGEPGAVEVADINGDTVPDIVAISEPPFGARQLVTLAGLGAGNFAAPISIPVTESFSLRDVHAVPLDGDEDVDLLVVVNFELRAMLGDGNGNFALTDTVALGGVVVDVLIEDLNADGNLDFAIARDGLDDVMVITGQGGGTFDTPQTTPVANDVQAIAAADLDLNGTLDLVVALGTSDSSSNDTAATFSGLGDGTFEPPIFISTVAMTGPLIAGTLDDGTTPLLVDAGRDLVLLGDGVGGFTTPIHHDSGPSPGPPTVVDVDGDGILDIAAVNTNDDTLSILRGLGAGAFAERVTYPVDPTAYEVLPGDFDNDGALDLLSHTANGIAIHFGNGDGTFGPFQVTDFGSSLTSLALGDFDADGVLDVAALPSIGNVVIVRRGRGNGSFYGPQNVPVSTTPDLVEVADLNGDGLDDVAVTMFFTSNLETSLGLGDGTFAPAVTTSLNFNAQDIVFADMNHDDTVDLVACSTQSMLVALGQGDGTFPTSTVTEGGSWILAVGDVDRDGVLDAVGSVSVFLGRGDGTLCPQASFRDTGAGAGFLSGVELADINADGWLDITTSRLFIDAIATFTNQWAP